MPDDIDRAVELEERQRAAGIAAARLPNGPGSHFCLDCDAEIPQRRREKHPSATRCVPCQQITETERVR